ncbi:helix-turn-helix domain-containing protein [Actinokineospora sp. G85]|uniref:helix-turn-helix domain-containing protein n=1 Tax=Actinokineospora sp. G85 TaxID=3406626 RepID=UPI003C712C00
MGLREPDSTVRLELLGEELRTHRERAGLSLAGVTELVGISTSKLSRMENGRRPQRIDDLMALLGAYRVPGGRRDELLALARGAAAAPVRPEQVAGRFAALRVLEAKAAMLVDVAPALVPALLQTVPYAQAVMREVYLLDERKVEDYTAGRIHRQAVLRREDPPRFFAILTEAALTSVVGGPQVLRGQLRYLLEAGARPNVTIRVVSGLEHGHPALDGPFQRMQFDRGRAVVLLESRAAAVYLEDPAEVKHYDRAVVELLSAALDERASAALIEKAIAGLSG